MERRQRRGASGAPIVEKRTERGQGALLGLGRTSFWKLQKSGAVSVVSGHNRSLVRKTNQISALFITVRLKARPKIVFIGREFTNPEPTGVITLPASVALPMTANFARAIDRTRRRRGCVTWRRARLPDAALR